MFSRHLLAAAGLAVLFVASQGCKYYTSKPEDAPGMTEAELKKVMEAPPDAPYKPVVLEARAEETMALLADGATAETATKAIVDYRRRVIGKVLEVSPDASEAPFLILDGGTHNNRAYKVKLTFAADQKDAVKQVKAGDEVRVEGSSDGVVNGDTLEFKKCSFDSGTTSSPSPSAKP